MVRIRAKQQLQASFLQLDMLCKNTSLPLSLEETFLHGTLGRNDLILVSILFYIFISLFSVIVSYSYLKYSPPLWNSHLASTWTLTVSFSQAPYYLCYTYLFFFFPHQSASPVPLYILVPLPEPSLIYLKPSAVMQPRTESSIFCLGSHQRHCGEQVPPSAVI